MALRAAAGIVGAGLWALSACGHAQLAFAPEVTGTGGSSSARVQAQWSFLFAKEAGIKVDFVAANSVVGIRAAIDRTADFSATEIAMPVDEVAKQGLLQFPLLIGGVVLVVNIPGVEPGALRLNSHLVSRIYLGEIKHWNDEEIRAINPGLSLPKLPIKLVVREGGTGTAMALSTYLTQTEPHWASRVGASDLPRWPAPTTKVATVKVMGETVRATPGAIGFLNYDEAYRNKLAYTQLRNRAGQYVQPSATSILAAANLAGLGRTGERIPVLINVGGDHTWPLVEVTFILLDRQPRNLERARSTLRYFYSAFLQGDQMAADSGFVPLPAAIQARNIGHFRDVVGPDKLPLDFLK